MNFKRSAMAVAAKAASVPVPALANIWSTPTSTRKLHYRTEANKLIKTLPALILAVFSAHSYAEFRVNPYLQNPSSDGMYFTWFSEEGTPGTIEISGPGLASPISFVTAPVFKSVLSYTNAEKNQNIVGLTKGEWLKGDNNYKHTVDVRGLTAGTEYVYTVTQGSDEFSSTFKTAPTKDSWSSIRFIAMSDAETSPGGRVLRREWAPGSLAAAGLPRPSASTNSAWNQKFGTSNLSGVRVLNYMLTEDEGYRRNLVVVNSRNPDFMIFPGDLVQGGGYQPAWDEFFRYNAGELGSGLSSYPILPALGNWENFGALNGGYGTDRDGRFAPKFARDKYDVYFDSPDNGTPSHRGNYNRVDYGPITVMTLDSSNSEPDDHPQNYAVKATGTQDNGPGTDTQSNFTRNQYEAAGGTDLADFNPGSAQWNWMQAQLADARKNGQIIFVQFHHVPFSSGEHGLPMDHELTHGQGGNPMRQYHNMFEQYGVVAVFSGHSEMFERSLVDGNGDGVGVLYYDVGVSGDGLRGGMRNGKSLNDPLLNYNPFSQWTADQSEPERWEMVDGVLQLVDGGKHYGHLETNLERIEGGNGRNGCTKLTLTPVYNFPILDSGYNLVSTERRIYNDTVTLYLDSTGQVIPSAVPGFYRSDDSSARARNLRHDACWPGASRHRNASQPHAADGLTTRK